MQISDFYSNYSIYYIIFREGLDAHSYWMKDGSNIESYTKAKARYATCHEVVSSYLSTNTAAYNYVAITIGLAILWLVRPNKLNYDL